MAKKNPPSPEAPKYASVQLVAALLKETPDRILMLVRKEGLPTVGRGRFDLTRVIHWREDYYRRKLQELQARRDERTLPEIAFIFRKDPRTITKLAKTEGLPRDERGIYNIVKVVQWAVEFYERQIREIRLGGETESQARKRLWQAQANLKEAQLATMRRELITRTDVELMLGPLLKSIREKLLGRSRRIAPQLQGLTPSEVEAMLLKYDTEALNELAALPLLLKKEQNKNAA